MREKCGLFFRTAAGFLAAQAVALASMPAARAKRTMTRGCIDALRLLLTIDLPTIATLANNLSFEIRHLQFSRFPCATPCRSFGISGAGFSTRLGITTRLPRRNETFLWSAPLGLDRIRRQF